MSEEKDKEHHKWYDSLAVLGLRMADSGLLPWMLVAASVLGGYWLTVRNLNSQDTLIFMGRVASLKGLALAGWVIALVEIPIFRWVLNRNRALNSSRIKQLEEETARSRAKLKEFKQAELELNGKT